MRGMVCFLIVLAALPVLALGEEFIPPKVTQYATDQTGTLSSGELAALDARLEQFEKETSNQILVLMVSSIGDTPLEEASLKAAEVNKLGQHGRDNGVLLFIVKDDRKIRIEVGYGLEGALTDITSGLIIRNEIIPRFRENDYYGGISAGVSSIMLATKNEYKGEPGGSRSGGFPVSIVMLLAIVFVVLRRIGRGGGGRRGGPFIFFPPMGGGWGGGGGGSFGGGGFGGGGFSGGGGSFGGGGASGSW